MELKIEPIPFAKVELDFPKFRNIYSQTFDLTKSLKKSLNVIESDTDETETKKSVIYQVNWGEVLSHLKKKDNIKIRFNLHLVDYEDWVMMLPKKIEQNHVEIENVKESGKSILVMCDLIHRTEFSINMFIQSLTFKDYDKDFSRVIM
jgi:hypothetical protein